MQKLLPQLPTLENLLNMLCSNSGIDKVFLVDNHTKIYVATDSSPIDMQTYHQCIDAVDVITDLVSVYSQKGQQMSVIRMNNGSVLYTRQVGDLWLVMISRIDSFDKNSVILHNSMVVVDGLIECLQLK